MEQRLSKYLAKCGISSRRGSDLLIEEGAVTVNSIVVYEPFYRIDDEKDIVEVRGVKCNLERAFKYVLLHKPRGYVCTSKDKFADKIALDLINLPERLFSIGRLDKDSEGLIIFTNDGDFAHRIGHPSYEITKIYHVTIDGVMTKSHKQKLENGILDDGEILKPQKVDLLRINSNDNQVLCFTLNEGKNREIRRLCAAMGWNVKKLQRVKIGNVTDNQLKVGQWRFLTNAEIDSFA